MVRLRFLLFWLLALAVPLQGFAAATRLLCDGAHGAHHSHATASEDGARLHVHGAAHADTGSGHEAHATPTGVADGGTHACGLCAACCHAIGVTREYQPVVAAPSAQAALAEPTPRIASQGVRLPDKPPRAA